MLGPSLSPEGALETSPLLCFETREEAAQEVCLPCGGPAVEVTQRSQDRDTETTWSLQLACPLRQGLVTVSRGVSPDGGALGAGRTSGGV